jgi:hypothetical protein
MADDRPENRLEDRPEDRPEDATISPDLGRPRRAPPTIDLEASEISGETANADAQRESLHEPAPEPPAAAEPGAEFKAEPGPAESVPASPISPWVIAPVSGAVAAALVIGVGWMLGWPAVPPAGPVTPPVDPQVNAQVNTAIDGLTARVASLESKVQAGAGKPANALPDPAMAARLAALEKSQASLRDELAATRAQSQKLATAVNGIQAAPGQAAATVDLSAINARLDQIEATARAEKAEIAKDSAKPADDMPLRRVTVASLLDLSVRQGDPFTATLEAAKALDADPDALKPLQAFASAGVPTAAMLSRELLTLVPKLSPKAPDNVEAGGGLVDRLEAGAARLVRIERTDATGTDRGAIVARVTAAALHNDSNEARRELNTLSPADRAAAQSWIDKADARDAALAASRQFAADAMAALAKPPH